MPLRTKYKMAIGSFLLCLLFILLLFLHVKPKIKTETDNEKLNSLKIQQNVFSVLAFIFGIIFIGIVAPELLELVSL